MCLLKSLLNLFLLFCILLVEWSAKNDTDKVTKTCINKVVHYFCNFDLSHFPLLCCFVFFIYHGGISLKVMSVFDHLQLWTRYIKARPLNKGQRFAGTHLLVFAARVINSSLRFESV